LKDNSKQIFSERQVDELKISVFRMRLLKLLRNYRTLTDTQYTLRLLQHVSHILADSLSETALEQLLLCSKWLINHAYWTLKLGAKAAS